MATTAPGVGRVLYWVPRVLGILQLGFVALFALDVFDAGYTFWGTVTALVIHLAPAWLLLVVLAVAWRWEWAGGVVYLSLAALFAAAGRGSSLTWLVIAGPLALTGALFLLHWAVHQRTSRDEGRGGDA